MPKIHPNNQTGLASLNKIAKDPRVTSVYTQGAGPSGREDEDYWVDLAPGWISSNNCCVIHEYSVEQIGWLLDEMTNGDMKLLKEEYEYES